MFNQADKTYACYLTLQLPYSDQILEEILMKEFDVTVYLNQIIQNDDIWNNQSRFNRTKNNPYLQQNSMCQILLKAILNKEKFQQVRKKFNQMGRSIQSRNINIDTESKKDLQNCQIQRLNVDINLKCHKIQEQKIISSDIICNSYRQLYEERYIYAKPVTLSQVKHLKGNYLWLLYLFNKVSDYNSKQFLKIFSNFTTFSLKKCIYSLSNVKQSQLQNRLNRFLQKSSLIQSKLVKSSIQKQLLYKILKIQNSQVNLKIQNQIEPKTKKIFLSKSSTICAQTKSIIQRQLLYTLLERHKHFQPNNPHSTRSKRIQKFFQFDSSQLKKKLSQPISRSSRSSSKNQSDQENSEQNQDSNEKHERQLVDEQSDSSFSNLQSQNSSSMEQEYEITKEQNKSHQKAFDQQTSHLNNQRSYNQKNIILFLLFQTNQINQIALSMIMNENVEQLKQYVKFNLKQIENTGNLYCKYYKENKALIPMIKFSTKQRSQYVHILLPMYFSGIERKQNQKLINLEQGEVWIQDEKQTNQYENEQVN